MIHAKKKENYKGQPIQLILNADQSIQWIALYELCVIFRRKEILEHENYIRKTCPSAIKIPLRQNGRPKWCITPDDVFKLIRVIKDENKNITEECKDFFNWFSDLLEKHTIPVRMKPDLSGFYDWKEHEVGFKLQNGFVYVNVTQFGKFFGVKPCSWYRTIEVKEKRIQLSENNLDITYEDQILTELGKQGATWVIHPLALNFIQFASNNDKSAQQWYESCLSDLFAKDKPKPRTLERIYPDTKKECHDKLRELYDERDEYYREQEENQDAIAFYNAFILSRISFKTGSIADQLGTTAQKLNEFLREQGIVRREYDKHVATRNYRSYQCEVPYWGFKNGTPFKSGFNYQWTHFGREEIMKKWKEHHKDTNNG